MIDRPARDTAIAVIELFLRGRITEYECGDWLEEIDTRDPLVEEAATLAWYSYTELKEQQPDHPKVGWDYFQRWQLLLKSDVEVRFRREAQRSWDHFLAFVALVAFLIVALFVGWGWELFIYSIPFAAVSIAISRYRKRREEERRISREEAVLAPFRSYSQIRWLRKRVPSFYKNKYRKETDRRRDEPQETSESFLTWYCRYILVPVPLVLLFQALVSPEDTKMSLRGCPANG